MPLFRFLGLVFFTSFLLSPGWTAEPSPPQPHLVTLRGQMSLSKAIEALRIPVMNQLGDDPKLFLNLNAVPFWQALDTMASAAQARVAIQPREGKIALVKRSAEDHTRISTSGPFRIALKGISVSRDLESGSHQAKGQVEVVWEPSLQPFYLETRPHDLVVKDNQGNPLPDMGLGSSLAPVDGRIALLFEVPLPAPPRAVSRLSIVEGRLSSIVPTRMLRFRFGSLDQIEQAPADAAVRQQKEDGITCRISKVVLEKERWTIQVVLDTPPGANKLDTYQSWLVNNELVLMSKDGTRRLTSTSDVVESVNQRRAVVSYNFTDRDGKLRGKPGDWNVGYTTPAAVVVMPIPFRFTDIALP